MAFTAKHVLLIGATSGIGKGMADALINQGIKVTAVGRRQDHLDAFVKQHGAGKASGVAFDLAEHKKAPQFAVEIMKKYPDTDCLFLNAGIQGKYDLSDFENIDLEKYNDEMTINYTSLVALTHAFLPYLKKQKEGTIIFTGSNVSIVPASVLPNYSASKTALNVFTMCLREQLKAKSSHVKIFEIMGPPVQTELHSYMGEAGAKMGMPLDQFTDLVMKGLQEGKDQINIGAIMEPKTFNELVENRRTVFENLAAMMRKMGA